MRERKTVEVGGVTWIVISRNERSTTWKGRHFFACRCNPRRDWRLSEDDQNIGETGFAKPLRIYTKAVPTPLLSETVREICGEAPPFVICDRDECMQAYGVELDRCPYCYAPAAVQFPSITHEQWRAQLRDRATKDTNA